MPIPDLLEAVQGGGIAITALAALVIIVFAPLIYITVLANDPSGHKRLIELVRALRRPRK